MTKISRFRGDQMKKMKLFSFPVALAFAAVVLISCAGREPAEPVAGLKAPEGMADFISFKLTADLSGLSDNQKQMLPLLIEAGEAMDAAYWIQAHGDKEGLLASIDDPALQRYVEINYGPWSRLNDNAPFIDGVGPKPAGANYYPLDMTKEEFEAAVAENKALSSLYTMVRRDEDGNLIAIPYNQFFEEQIKAASDKLLAAAELADDPGFKSYLELRAQALLSNEYFESDLAWMDMKENMIDVVVGPIETYEDQLYGNKASFETFVLLKDMEWSERLSKYAAMLPELQEGLPVPDKYKAEVPGTDSDLNAYDAIYYGGDCNAGSKTIAINLPNDEKVQAQKGSRRLQLKNSMQAKFDKILVPIAGQLVVEDQRQHVTFNAFFSNTMFHEVAHGLGIANTLDGSGTVREALQEQASALEEGKADILGLYMVTKLHEKGELGDAPLEDYYTTFMASIFRSSRFGAASAHGRANMVRFNYFLEMGAFSRDEETGLYRADYGKMRQAVDAMSEMILRLQGDGDYKGVQALMAEKAIISGQLQQDLDRLAAAGIPVDIIFEQGVEALGL
jgi:hypothetical protein